MRWQVGRTLASTRMSYLRSGVGVVLPVVSTVLVNTFLLSAGALGAIPTVEIIGKRQVTILLQRRSALPHASGGSVSCMQILVSPLCRGVWSSVDRLVGLHPSRPHLSHLCLPHTQKKKKPWAGSEVFLDGCHFMYEEEG